MDELLKEALASILKTSIMSETEKLELISAVHVIYKYLDRFED